ncbi:MAG: endonuclease MutS2 [Bacteroidota bacterium]
MIYPENFEQKIGMTKIREIVSGFCLYDPGREEVMNLHFSSDPGLVRSRLKEVEEFRKILFSDSEFPIENFIDISPSLSKARVEGRFLEVFELVNLKKALESVRAILNFFKKDENDKYPELKKLAREVKFFPAVHDRLNQLINKQGNIRDNASPELSGIRNEIRRKEGSISRILNKVLEKARKDGLIDEDSTLSVRNGRTVIPVPSSNKRRVEGYIHDESATGRTVYIEPSVVVETNNELRELENQEKREIVKILTAFTDFIRPYIEELRLSHIFLAKIDSIRARARFAMDIGAFMPRINDKPEVDWKEARHPLLLLSFRNNGRQEKVVPLEIKLEQNKRLLIISGPNAGGKSVCLQTLGLLQMMCQSGFLVTAGESSVFGVFEKLFLDMGDEQSIEDDLSTYSSHLLNMKTFLRDSDDKSLILIDEFGSGTEPALGAAISEAVLENLNDYGVFGVITTHYTNLKHFASAREGMINGAMLFDTQHMQPLFKLSVGKPGSSFAFEIARKTGLPEEILKAAEEKVGREHVDFDRHLKDIIRDKKYWSNKRQRIRINEKKLAELVERYDTELSDTEKLRKKILKEAKEESEKLLSEANKRIENTIREIKEVEAEKEKTRNIRKDLEKFKEQVESGQLESELKKDTQELRNKLSEIKKRNRHFKKPEVGQAAKKKPIDTTIREGDRVLMKGQNTPGEVLKVKPNKIEVAFGNIKTSVKPEVLEKIPQEKYEKEYRPKAKRPGLFDWEVGKRKLSFSPDIDVRGKRADDAIRTIREFIDEAVMVQARDLRILHGKGNGILRELIRQQLSSMDIVEWYGDEHVERGGSGITLVKLGI